MAKETETNPLTAEPTPFDEWIADFKEGRVNDEITAALAEVVVACRTVKKAGSVVLKITVEADPSDDRYMRIVEAINTKIPQESRVARLQFGTPTGALVVDNPYAKRLAFESVEVDPTTGETTND